MIQKKWFAVEQHADGSLGAVTEAPAKGRNGSVVRYYEAVDAADACAQAKEWYENYSKVHARGAAAGRARKMAAGKCTNCGINKGPDATRWHCRGCADKQNARDRERTRLGCVTLPKKSVNVAEMRDKRRALDEKGRERKIKLSGSLWEYNKGLIFSKALKESYAFTNLFQFQEWLRAQIRERGLEPPVKPSKKIDWLEDKIAKAAK